MERVTDEWLYCACERICEAHTTGPYSPAFRLAFAQAVARECERIAKEVETERTITQVLDKWGAEIVARKIRARFGLED